jgi:hypothetical protein
VERDPTLRGVERNSFLIAGALTAAACFVRPWPEVAFGVIGGALLAGFSYWSLKSSVSMLVLRMTAMGSPGSPPAVAGPADPVKTTANLPRELAKLTLRYALLALLAYVMIARLRLHPWGLLAGASSVVAGVSLQAVLLLVKK